MCVRACVRACVCACVFACLLACVRVCVCAPVRVCDVFAIYDNFIQADNDNNKNHYPIFHTNHTH